MTTYAFSAQAFEDVPFPRLRGGGCRNITVLADRGMLNMSFDEFGPPRYAGTLYHVVKATMPGAFHPKIALLAGAAKGRLMIGSANLTGLGLGGNRELVADLAYTTDNPEFTPLFGHIPFDIAGFMGRKLLVRLVTRGLFHRVLTMRTPMGRRFRAKMHGHGMPLIRTRPGQLKRAGVHRIGRIAARTG